MNFQEKNILITEMANAMAARSCAGGDLKIMPIENGYTRRPRYYQDSNNMHRFSVFMWQVNRLSGEALIAELDHRIRAAATHFGLEYRQPVVVMIPSGLRDDFAAETISR